MINAIINGIFKLITSLAGAILSPFVAFISDAFPSLRTCYYEYYEFFNASFSKCAFNFGIFICSSFMYGFII